MELKERSFNLDSPVKRDILHSEEPPQPINQDVYLVLELLVEL
jgi:hypothetical protein